MEFIIAYLWLSMSIVIGAVGSKRRIGFFGAFLASLLLSPICGLILVTFSYDNSDQEFKATVIELLEKKAINYDDL